MTPALLAVYARPHATRKQARRKGRCFGSRGRRWPSLVTWSNLTERLGQPYRIEIRDGTKLVYAYEPMKSERVRSRLPQLARFYAPS